MGKVAKKMNGDTRKNIQRNLENLQKKKVKLPSAVFDLRTSGSQVHFANHYTIGFNYVKMEIHLKISIRTIQYLNCLNLTKGSENA